MLPIGIIVIVISSIISIIAIFLGDETLNSNLKKIIKISAITLNILLASTSIIFYLADYKQKSEDKIIDDNRFKENISKQENSLKKLIETTSKLDTISDNLQNSLAIEKSLLYQNQRNLTLLKDIAISFEYVFSCNQKDIKGYSDFVKEYIRNNVVFKKNIGSIIEFYSMIYKKSRVPRNDSDFLNKTFTIREINDVKVYVKFRKDSSENIEFDIRKIIIENGFAEKIDSLMKLNPQKYLDENYYKVIETISNFSSIQASFDDLLILQGEDYKRNIILDFDYSTLSLGFDTLHLQKRIIDEGLIISFLDLFDKKFSLRNVSSIIGGGKNWQNSTVILPDKISDVRIYYGNNFTQKLGINSKIFIPNSPNGLYKYFDCILTPQNMELNIWK
ncbi:MAG: hypothetical protein HOO91_16760 [Bacteroidales bacterium]|nr:hypothetical protein [Bacteroidales bacterium]